MSNYHCWPWRTNLRGIAWSKTIPGKQKNLLSCWELALGNNSPTQRYCNGKTKLPSYSLLANNSQPTPQFLKRNWTFMRIAFLVRIKGRTLLIYRFFKLIPRNLILLEVRSPLIAKSPQNLSSSLHHRSSRTHSSMLGLQTTQQWCKTKHEFEILNGWQPRCSLQFPLGVFIFPINEPNSIGHLSVRTWFLFRQCLYGCVFNFNTFAPSPPSTCWPPPHVLK